MITDETYARLESLTKGVLNKSTVRALQIPDSSELNQLQYVFTRVNPSMVTYTFISVEAAVAAIGNHVQKHGTITAKVTSKSNKAIAALLINDGELQGAIVNPFTYGASPRAKESA